MEGKAVWVREEADLTLHPEWATDTEFMVVVQSEEVYPLNMAVVYAPLGAARPLV